MLVLHLITLDYTHKLRHTTLGMTPLDEGSARRRALYLTAHDIHNRQTAMPPTGFEPSILPRERPQPYALDSAGTTLLLRVSNSE